MKLNISTYLLCLLFCTISIQAFTQQITQTYSFDVDSLMQYKNFNESALFAHLDKGIKNQALLLNAHEKQYLKLPYQPSDKAFSVSFWFQIPDAQSYPLIYQTQIDDKNRVQKYIELGINNHQIYMKDNHRVHLIQAKAYQEQQWHLLNYIFDGYKHIKCFIDGKLVNTHTLTTLCKERPNHSNAIFIAKGYKYPQKLDNNYLHGAIDELQIVECSLDSLEIQQMYQIHIAQTKTRLRLPINPPIKSIQQDIVVVEPKPKTTKIERNSKEQKSIQVNNPLLKIELWDYDEYDKDKISVYLNDETLPYQSLENILLPKEKQKISRDIVLSHDEINTLTFFALDLGTWYVQNTIGIVVYEIEKNGRKKLINPKNEKGKPIPYKLICTGQENAVLTIRQQPKAKSYCKAIDLGKTSETSVVLQISSKQNNLLKYIYIDEKKTVNFKISKIDDKKKIISYTLQLTDNDFHTIPIAIKPIDRPINNEVFYIKLKKDKLPPNKNTKLKDEYIYNTSTPFAFESNSKIDLQLRHEQKASNIAAAVPPMTIDKTVGLGKHKNTTDFELRIQDVLRKKGTKLVIMFDDEIITDTISLKRKQTISLPKIATTKNESYIKIIPIEIGKQITIDAKIVTKDKGNFIEDFKLTIKETKEPTILALKR